MLKFTSKTLLKVILCRIWKRLKKKSKTHFTLNLVKTSNLSLKGRAGGIILVQA